MTANEQFYEPWTVDADGEVSNSIDNIIVDPTGSTVPFEDEARYMRRIVACVNACAGGDTALLEALGVGGIKRIVDEMAEFVRKGGKR